METKSIEIKYGKLSTDNLSNFSVSVLQELVDYRESLNKEDLIEPKCKYVSLIGYQSKFNRPYYKFAFYGASTLEDALKLESLETAIVRDINDKYRLASDLEELENEIKSCFTQEEVQEFISEEVQKISYKFNLLQKQRSKRRKIILSEEEILEVA